MMVHAGHSNDSDLFEGPFSERLGQFLVAALLNHFVAGATGFYDVGLEEFVGEKVERADEHGSGVVAGLQAGDQ